LSISGIFPQNGVPPILSSLGFIRKLLGHDPTLKVVETLLAERPLERLRAVQAILALQKSVGVERLEAACARALVLDSCSYQSITSILKTKLDQQPLPPTEAATGTPGPVHENLRGPAYYQGPQAPLAPTPSARSPQ
jgi:DNA-binding NarL/FixJ family response regulator